MNHKHALFINNNNNDNHSRDNKLNNILCLTDRRIKVSISTYG